MRRAARRDENEPEIVQVLESVGATVFRMDDPCDLLVGYRGRNFLMEVKQPGRWQKRRGEKQERTNRKQNKFALEWRGQLSVVETPEIALRVIGAMAR